MRYFFRSLTCSILEVVVIVVCFRGQRSAEIAQSCVGSQLSLRCPETQVIEITAVVLGDTDCFEASCCIRDDDCTQNASENYRIDVRRRCDNKQNCTVDVLKEGIDCGALRWLSNNDFERITYNCTNDPKNHLTSTDGTLANLSSNTDINDQKALPVVTVIICLIILLAIVVGLFVVMYLRKCAPMRKRLFHPIAMTKVDNLQNETDIHANETQETSLQENNDPLYTLLDEVHFPKTEESPTCLLAEAVSKTPSPQDDGDQTVLENDLYYH